MAHSVFGSCAQPAYLPSGFQAPQSGTVTHSLEAATIHTTGYMGQVAPTPPAFWSPQSTMSSGLPGTQGQIPSFLGQGPMSSQGMAQPPGASYSCARLPHHNSTSASALEVQQMPAGSSGLMNQDPRTLAMGLDLNGDGQVNQIMRGPLGVDVDNDGTVDVVISPERLLQWVIQQGKPVTAAGAAALPPQPRAPPPKIPVPVEAEALRYPQVVREERRTPIVIKEYVDRPIYRDTVEEHPVFLDRNHEMVKVTVRTVQRKEQHRPDYPYHHPDVERGCDFWGAFQPHRH